MPSLLLLAADTRLYDPESVAERARRLLPDVTIEITPNAGHGVVFQYPDQITARILQFIDAHDHDPETHRRHDTAGPLRIEA